LFLPFVKQCDNVEYVNSNPICDGCEVSADSQSLISDIIFYLKVYFVEESKSVIDLTFQIKDLFEMSEAKEYPQFKAGEPGLFNKQQSIPNTPIEIWTASGWSPLKRTIRHYCHKNIYRVITPTGIVDVTEDHSLLDLKLNQIKPGNLCQGSELFHCFPNNLQNIIGDVQPSVKFTL
jgi:hypothetical protein